MGLSPLRVASGVSAGGTGSDLDCFKHTRPSHGWLYMQGSLGQFDFPSQPAQLLERGEKIYLEFFCSSSRALAPVSELVESSFWDWVLAR